MKRKFIPLNHIEIFDEMHLPHNGSFIVDEARDGQSTQKHIDGINYIKEIISRGQKIRPILVVEHKDGTFTRLDGFKRCMAYRELGVKLIEALVCDEKELSDHVSFQYHTGVLRCDKGGQPKEHFTLFEGGERPNFNYDENIFLYKSDNPDGLRIEVSECIHVHWGKFGRYRLSLGRRDFETLAEGISKLWEK